MLLWIIIGAVGLAGALMAYLFFNQEQIIFLPKTEFQVTPEDFNLKYEEMRLNVTDQSTVHGWYFPADSGGPTIMFCHGNAGNISHRLETAEYLVSLGVNVLLFDYRGYGQATGSPTEAGLYADAQAALDWLTREKNLSASQVTLFGRSLGGAVAVELASRTEFRGLIVESGFSSMPDMAQVIYPWLPVRYLVRHKLASVEKIGDVKCPILIMHSQTDEIIPYWMGRRLFDEATSKKRFYELEGPHNNLEYYQSEEYRDHLLWLINGAAE